MLSEKFCALAEQGWSDVFSEERTLRRALEQSVGMLCCLGRRTISVYVATELRGLPKELAGLQPTSSRAIACVSQADTMELLE